MLLNHDDFRSEARKVLPRFVFDYVDGAAEDGNCLRRNRADFDSLTLTPRVLRDTSEIDTGINVFGADWSLPFGIAPTGLNGLVRPGGDAMLAAAAAAAGVPFSLSTASNMRLEDIREVAPAGEQWMQLYVMHRSLAERIVLRAQKAGYRALVLTVDVPVGGNRELDLRNGFRLPFKPTFKLACDLAMHPMWSLRMAANGVPAFANLSAECGEGSTAGEQAALLSRSMDRTLVWDSLAWLRKLWAGPLLLKGVQHADDARIAIDHGVDGLIVSNHGGRQFDAAPSAIAALPGVVAAAKGRVPVFMDSGIRRGSDIAKAIGLGATAVFLGRPILFALAARGRSGADAALRLYREEFVRAMILLGASSVEQLRTIAQVDSPSDSRASRP